MSPEDAPGSFLADPAVGHTLAAAACHKLAVALSLSDPGTLLSQPLPAHDECQAYTLRHGVAHLCLSNDVKRLETVVHNLGFWEHACAAGKS